MRLACSDKPLSFAALAEVDNALTFANALVMSTDPKLRRIICQCLSKNNNPDLIGQFIRRFPSCTVGILTHDAIDICPLAYTHAQRLLHQRLGVLLVSVVLQPYQEESNTYASIMVELLEKQTRMADIPNSCGCHHPQKRLPESARIALFEAESTPQMNSVSHGWRENLRRTMSRDANCRYDSVIRIFGEVCRDLEARCLEVEHPLRQEQAVTHELREHSERSKVKIAQLEAQVEHREHVLSDLKDEITRLQGQFQSAQKRSQDLTANLATINEEVVLAKSEAERAIKSSAESARQQDLVYLATLTGKDEMYEEISHKLVNAENRAKDLEHQLLKVNSQESRNAEIIHADNLALDELRDAVAVAKTLAETRQEQIDHLVESGKELKAIHDDVAARAKEAAASNTATISALESQIRTVTTELAQFKEDHDARVVANALEYSRLEEQNRGIIDGLQAELKEAHNKAMLTIKHRDSTLAGLQEKVKRLRHEREARVKEFAEAQVLSSRLMAVVGIKNRQSLLSVRDKKLSIHHQCASEDEAASTRYSDVNISGSSGPTTPAPKRTRTHRVPKSSVFSSKTGGRVGATAKQSRHRTPLKDLESMQHQNFLVQAQSQSRKECPVQHESLSEGMQENSKIGPRLDSGNESFGGGDAFMSTEQDHLPRSTYDETTDDF